MKPDVSESNKVMLFSFLRTDLNDASVIERIILFIYFFDFF